jgi:MFS transporter, AAHS family, 4-hydroxybenzoate transporter
MSDQPVIRVSQFLDERGVGPFQIRLLVWSFLIVLIDGYDIGAIAFAAPHLIADWHISPSALGPIFSAALIGILFGSAFFGWVGDRFGRKAALIGAMVWFGIWSLATVWATGAQEMFWLRLVTGIGIGGIIPNVVALNAECAPRNRRGTLAITAAGMVPLGGAIPGMLSAWLVAGHGWQILFLIGGIGPLVIAAASVFGLSESVKFMVLHERHRGNIERLIRSIRPDAIIPPNARFVIEDEKVQFSSNNPLNLFKDGMAVITPLLWLMFALNLMGYFFLASWTPTLLTVAHLPPVTAAYAGVIMQVGGTVGSISLASWIDRHRFVAIVILFCCAVPVVAIYGYIGVLSFTGLMIISFLAGFFVLGVQSGINGIGALVYPTSLRANGSGWELGVGRFGSIVGPLLGTLLVGLPVSQLYLLSSLPFVGGAVVTFTIHKLNQARLQERPWAREEQAVGAE